jgi:hypothetical protein
MIGTEYQASLAKHFAIPQNQRKELGNLLFFLILKIKNNNN